MENNNARHYLMTAVKGICMGAADVIPGVSGGTIAFMTGIYEELVGSINSINGTAVKLLFKGKIRQFWKHINGNFLFSLIAGILLSIFSLARLMQYLLDFHPIQTWAFFFGLIVASSIFILKEVKQWKFKDILQLIFGIILGVVICTLSPTQTPDGLWFIFLSGAIAICAMILPGISGSFILLILGKYEYLMGRIADIVSGKAEVMDFIVLITFALGAIIGIIAFSKFLHWLLHNYHRPTLLVLAGFIIGSLVKVWPWSNKIDIVCSQFPDAAAMMEAGTAAESAISGNGDASAIADMLVDTYYGQTDPYITGAAVFALAGFILVLGIEAASKMIQRKRENPKGPDNAALD